MNKGFLDKKDNKGLFDKKINIHLYNKTWFEKKLKKERKETLEWVKEQIKKIRPYHIHHSINNTVACANLEDIMKILEEKSK
jgi:isopropylmalate/homocitrate/citramalate synthase